MELTNINNEQFYSYHFGVSTMRKFQSLEGQVADDIIHQNHTLIYHHGIPYGICCEINNEIDYDTFKLRVKQSLRRLNRRITNLNNGFEFTGRINRNGVRTMERTVFIDEDGLMEDAIEAYYS
jgi:hypothetical protein